MVGWMANGRAMRVFLLAGVVLPFGCQEPAPTGGGALDCAKLILVDASEFDNYRNTPYPPVEIDSLRLAGDDLTVYITYSGG